MGVRRIRNISFVLRSIKLSHRWKFQRNYNFVVIKLEEMQEHGKKRAKSTELDIRFPYNFPPRGCGIRIFDGWNRSVKSATLVLVSLLVRTMDFVLQVGEHRGANFAQLL